MSRLAVFSVVIRRDCDARRSRFFAVPILRSSKRERVRTVIHQMSRHQRTTSTFRGVHMRHKSIFATGVFALGAAVFFAESSLWADPGSSHGRGDDDAIE